MPDKNQLVIEPTMTSKRGDSFTRPRGTGDVIMMTLALGKKLQESGAGKQAYHSS